MRVYNAAMSGNMFSLECPAIPESTKRTDGRDHERIEAAKKRPWPGRGCASSNPPASPAACRNSQKMPFLPSCRSTSQPK